MPIQIIDNFELGAAKPIDNRFVVGAVDSFYADKDDIPHKYIGLRIWDLSSGAPGAGYVWDGSAWQGEAGGSVTSTGSAGFISKFLATPTTIDDSVIFESAGLIGIGTLAPNKKLTVNGGIRSLTDGFYGNGANITNINASNITTGSLSLSRIADGTSTYIITQGGSGPEWTDPSTITVGQSDQTDLVKHTTDNSYSNWSLITFVNTTTTTSYHELKKTNSFAIKPSNGSIYMAPGSGTVNIGTVTSNTSYKLWIVGGTSYGLLVDNFARFNSGVGIASPGSGQYALRVGSYGSSYPLRVESLSGLSSYFVGSVGIGTGPSSTYRLYVSGDVRATSRFFAGNGNQEEPSFSFGSSSFDDYGMYKDNQLSVNGLGFTVGGFLRLKIRLGGGTDFEFWNGNASNLGLNGALINYGTYLQVGGGFTHLDISGNLYASGTKSFKIQHPLDKDKYLMHAAIEGPRVDNIYRGTTKLVKGKSEINIDSEFNMTQGTFESLNRDIQCFTSNETGFDNVKGTVIGNKLLIDSSNSKSTDTISWMVIGERKDKSIIESVATDENGKLITETSK